MKMRTLGAAAIALMLAPVAVAQSQSQQIAGRWTCFGDTPDGMISGQMNYGSDGIVRSTLIMAIANSDGQVIMDVTANWQAPGDGTLRERVTKLDIVRFMMDGQVADDEPLRDAFADMMNQELQSGSLEITAKTMTMIDADGIRTSCTR